MPDLYPEHHQKCAVHPQQYTSGSPDYSTAKDLHLSDELKDNPAFYICDSVYDAASQSDVLVVMTKWPEFNSINIPKIIELMQKKKFDKPVLFDCVNMFSQYDNSFTYIAA